jgi:ketosteroid isomerase-like protein
MSEDQAGVEQAELSLEQAETLFREGYGAFNRGDLDGMLEMFQPDAEWDMSRWGTELGERFTGREAIRRYLENMVRLWERIGIHPDEVLPTSDPSTFIVVVRVVVSSRGADVEGRYPNVITLVDGKAACFRAFTNLDDALASIG